jgi:mannitol/fructose-specific phosphotransferase system IIA component (Ntr-type)
MAVANPADFTSASLIVPELRGRTSAEAIDELLSILWRHGKMGELAPVRELVMNRELASPTVVKPGWAMPHARIPGKGELCFALGRCPAGLTWFNSDGLRVRVVFLFVVPESEAMSYLRLVSALARLSGDASVCAQLLAAPDAAAILRLLAPPGLRAPDVGPGNR